MSPELETLDQLQGSGVLPLTMIQLFFSDASAFLAGVTGLLSGGDVRLIGADGLEIPVWRWRELFREGAIMQELDQFRLEITDQGAKRIG